MEAINANPEYNDEVVAKLRSIVDAFMASGAY
jgi:hypothetical protein